MGGEEMVLQIWIEKHAKFENRTEKTVKRCKTSSEVSTTHNTHSFEKKKNGQKAISDPDRYKIGHQRSQQFGTHHRIPPSKSVITGIVSAPLPVISNRCVVSDCIHATLPLDSLQRLVAEEILDHIIRIKGKPTVNREHQWLLYMR